MKKLTRRGFMGAVAAAPVAAGAVLAWPESRPLKVKDGVAMEVPVHSAEVWSHSVVVGERSVADLTVRRADSIWKAMMVVQVFGQLDGKTTLYREVKLLPQQETTIRIEGVQGYQVCLNCNADDGLAQVHMVRYGPGGEREGRRRVL